eukprot:tig00021589_g22712.t1
MEDASSRKARLAAMRAEAEAAQAMPTDDADGGSGDEGEDGEEENSGEPVVRFRNYAPRNPELKELKLPRPELSSVEEQIKKATQHHTASLQETNESLINVATKKPNWDLKRDVAKRLEKLQKRTQRAILELIEEKLKAEGEEGSDEESEEDS